LRQSTSRKHWLKDLKTAIGAPSCIGSAVLLAAIGADEAKIEASFREAIRIAGEQKAISLAKRAEATYAEYRRQKASGSGGPGVRLPLW
jgi:hypothetical protein